MKFLQGCGYTLTGKGQELVESVINLLQWMRKWSKAKKEFDTNRTQIINIYCQELKKQKIN
jgi:DNA-binding HxlR family transcriptional regulator